MNSTRLETAEQVLAIVDSSTTNELKRAVKLLFAKSDIIEVRAWDNTHNVFTGRYKYGKTLIDMLELFDADGCDVYYVLNPVGDKHGLRTMESGGLCTWEKDVPFRRRFLLDFDPVRTDKIATNEQWQDAYDTAVRAMTWLQSYGYRGIILASSGNGCHLLVPCNLPNDANSKELIRKVQRAVAVKCGTTTVECECFPDANRLVRAYGSTNKKGTPTEETPHRLSGVIIAPDAAEDDAQGKMEAILRDNPVADTKKHNLGTGAGPFSRDILFERLEAWQDGWTNDDSEDFEFEETDRHDGFRVLCPGALSDGWPDGESHGEQGTSLNDSCIVYVENGWPRFSCRHNHCGEGAEHGKKTWMDLQNFYDKERSLHRIMDETDYAAKWNIEYLDDGVVDKGTADVDKLLAEDEVLDFKVEDSRSLESKMTETERKDANNRALASTYAEEMDAIDREEQKLKQELEEGVDKDKSESLTASDDAPAEDQPKRKKLTNMPESCMYGWVGEAARHLETPLGYAYPAMLTAAAAQINIYPRHIRPTLYTCLIGPVHCGKSETIKRAIGYKNIPGFLYCKPDLVKWTVPGSDRGLIKIFSAKKDEKKDKENAVVMEMAFTKLLAQDELRNTLAKANISGSSLPATLCSLWSQDEAGAADKTGEHSATVQLNLLGALKADDAEDFAEVFGKDSTAGLYDRFIFGLASKGWEYETWEREMQYRSPKGCVVPKSCFDTVKAWRSAEPVGRGRLAEIALRVAYITSAMNHDTEVTAESVQCALQFCEWQELIRSGWKAGLGDSVDALCTGAILTVLEKLEPGVWIKWGAMATAKNWYRKFGSRVLSATRDALLKSGVTVEETVTEEHKDGHKTPKRTGRIRLRRKSDD